LSKIAKKYGLLSENGRLTIGIEELLEKRSSLTNELMNQTNFCRMGIKMYELNKENRAGKQFV